jgi:hypothetical protein
MPAGRILHQQLIHEISAQLGPADIARGSGVLGTLPNAAPILLTAHLVTSTAFDPTTLTLSLGFAGQPAAFLAAQNIKPAGRFDLPITASPAGFYPDTAVIWTATVTGGPATVGLCTIWLEYIPVAG